MVLKKIAPQSTIPDPQGRASAKWTPVFRKAHAPQKNQSAIFIALWRGD
jgi:hypothetical protein